MFDTAKVVLIFFSVFANFFIGLISLRKNPSNIVNRSLAIFAWVFSMWSLSLFFYDYPVILNSLIWIKITFTIVVFGIIGCLYYFAYIFPEGKRWPPVWGQISFFVLATFFSGAILFSDLFVQSVSRESWGYETKLGPLYYVFNAFASFYGFGGLIILIKKFRKALGYERSRLKYMFLGLTFFVFSVLILDSIIPLLTHDSRFFSVSTATSLFFVGFTTYAIIKHRLLDIRMVTSTVVVFLLETIIIASICVIGAVSFWLVTNTPFKAGVFIVILVCSVVLVYLFPKLQFLVRMIASQYLRLPVYDFQETLQKLSSGLSSFLEIPALSNVVIDILTKAFKINSAAILVKDFPRNNFRLQTKIGFMAKNYDLLLEDSIISYLEVNTQIVIAGEVRRLIDEKPGDEETAKLAFLHEQMEKIDIEVMVPVIHTKRILGLIILGDKLSGDPYTVQDIRLLTTLASQASVALENARLYQELSGFNKTLQQKIAEATADLQKANERLKSLDELKDDFVSIASHELRTPMTAIRSYAWMALHRADVPLSEKMEKYLIRVLMSSERLINLVNDMLNISRIEAGKIEINPEPIDPISLCKDIIDEVYYSKSLSKKINFHLLEDKVPQVFADPDKLRQVLLNLVGNSLKFTPDGGSITLSCFSDGRGVEISVKDTGTGISKDDMGRLFQKFSRLDNSYVAAATSGGTGLGLYISKKIIELMHGRIWAYSEGVGKGATFTLSLPVASEEVLQNADLYTIKPVGEMKPLEPAAI